MPPSVPPRPLLSLAIAVILLCLLALAPAPLAALQDFPPEAELAAMARYVVEDGEATGFVLGVLEADGTTRVVGYGDGGPGAPTLDADAVFEIGSVTKLFTGALLADMVARGEVALDDPVARYLPEGVLVPAYEGREITLLDLATHTSALPRDPGVLADFSTFHADSLYALLPTLDLARAPGEAVAYSNLGYGLLGHALARAAGLPLRDLMRERVFAPLGMTSTTWAADRAAAERTVVGHAAGVALPAWEAADAVAGAGGLRSSARDLLAFLAAHLGEPSSPLEEALRMAPSPRVQGEGGVGIGLAWHSGRLGGRPLAWHTGVVGGFRAAVAFDPQRGVAVVTLANSTAYQEALARELLANGPPPAPATVAVDADRLGGLTGMYASAGGLPFAIRLDHAGKLTAQGRDQVRYRLYPTSDSTFYALRLPFGFTFRRDGAGRGTEILLDVGGRTNSFPRVADATPSAAELAGNMLPALPAAALERYAGTYLLEAPGGPLELRIYPGPGVLMAERGPGAASPLVPAGEDTFTLAISPSIQVRFTMEDGQATGAEVSLGSGLTLPGRRIR